MMIEIIRIEIKEKLSRWLRRELNFGKITVYVNREDF
jgi:hypothetical protein